MHSRYQDSHRRRGAITVLAAVLMVFLVGMVAFAVDIGYLLVVQTQAQAAADAAAMAGAAGLGSGAAVANAQSCAAKNTANGQSVTLQSSDVVLGTWNSSSRTFTALSGSGTSSANAVQVTVNLTSGRGNPVNLFFAKVFGMGHSDIAATAIAGGSGRADTVISQDISGSYADDLSYAVAGGQALLSDFNTSSPSSYFGVAQHGGWGSTWAALQQVGAHYSSLNTAIGNLQDCNNNTTSAYNVYGGTTSSIAVTTQTPSCCGSDLATGMQQAINMFNSSAYISSAGTNAMKAIVVSSDGASNADSNGQHPGYSDTQLDALAQSTADAAWAQGISVYVLYYNHGGSSYDEALLQSLVRGKGIYLEVTDPTQLSTALVSLLHASGGTGILQ